MADDPLELLRRRRLEQRLAVVEGLGELDRPCCGGRAARSSRALPLDERQVDERLAVELEQVEDVVDERRPGFACCIAEKLGRPWSSSAHTSPSSDAVERLDGLRRAARDAAGSADREVVAVPAAELAVAART